MPPYFERLRGMLARACQRVNRSPTCRRKTVGMPHNQDADIVAGRLWVQSVTTGGWTRQLTGHSLPRLALRGKCRSPVTNSSAVAGTVCFR